MSPQKRGKDTPRPGRNGKHHRGSTPDERPVELDAAAEDVLDDRVHIRAEAAVDPDPSGGTAASTTFDPATGDVVHRKRQKLDLQFYENELIRLQVELVKLQEWIRIRGLKVVCLFEGRDAAGKGGVIKRITETLNPRVARIVALGVPTERERSQWYFQRYAAQLPAAGEWVLFDRSWYNRAGVEHVMGFCTEDEYREFLRTAPEFERMLMRSGIILLKYWFSVSDEEQERRFQARINDPTKRWKISPMDVVSRSHWVDYSRA